MPRALIVDDDTGFCLGLADALRREGLSAVAAGTVDEARRALVDDGFDVLFVDLNLPDGNGLDLLGATEADFVLVTGEASGDTLMEALRRGAQDCLAKPVDLVRLRMTLVGLARAREAEDEVTRLRSELRALGRFGFLVGSSAAMQLLYDRLLEASRSDIPVLMTGEAGTGKELAARTLNRLGRSRAPFATVSRDTDPGPPVDERGLLRAATGGTLFVSEVTDLPDHVQAVLLRFLDISSLRVVASTRRDPDEAVAAGVLDEGLRRRLSAFRIALPPLRERDGDIELLSGHFLARLNERAGSSKRLTPAALERLRSHPWPGNVRELRDCLGRAFLSVHDEIDAQALSLGRVVHDGG